MKATILVTIDTGDDSDLLSICDEIREAVENHTNVEVSSVKPWHRDTLLPVAPLLQQPPPLQPPVA